MSLSTLRHFFRFPRGVVDCRGDRGLILWLGWYWCSTLFLGCPLINAVTAARIRFDFLPFGTQICQQGWIGPMG